MFMSVFSFVVVAGVDCWITVVLLSFFSAGGLVTVVSFCSQAANSATPASRQMHFFIQTNRISLRTGCLFGLVVRSTPRGSAVIQSMERWRQWSLTARGI